MFSTINNFQKLMDILLMSYKFYLRITQVMYRFLINLPQLSHIFFHYLWLNYFFQNGSKMKAVSLAKGTAKSRKTASGGVRGLGSLESGSI